MFEIIVSFGVVVVGDEVERDRQDRRESRVLASACLVLIQHE